MTYNTSIQTVTDLRHITFPNVALGIALTGFWSLQNTGHYDAGANFLGVLGQNSNTQPIGDGATVTCTWTGLVSDPMPYAAPEFHTPNVLYDFNGSGAIHPNNDPRYFLPYGSTGLILNSIAFHDADALLQGWCYWHGEPFGTFYERGRFLDQMLKQARKFVADLNARCAAGQVKLSVTRGAPPKYARPFWQRALAKVVF